MFTNLPFSSSSDLLLVDFGEFLSILLLDFSSVAVAAVVAAAAAFLITPPPPPPTSSDFSFACWCIIYMCVCVCENIQKYKRKTQKLIKSHKQMVVVVRTILKIAGIHIEFYISQCNYAHAHNMLLIFHPKPITYNF